MVNIAILPLVYLLCYLLSCQILIQPFETITNTVHH